MEEKIEQAYLYDFYGELLNEHQRHIFEDYIFNDLYDPLRQPLQADTSPKGRGHAPPSGGAGTAYAVTERVSFVRAI